MLTAQGPKVLEFNVVLVTLNAVALCIRLESSLLELIDAAVDRRLNEIPLPTWKSGASVTVVMASEGYPETVEKDMQSQAESSGLTRQCCGIPCRYKTSPDDSETVLTSGGRVRGDRSC